MLAGASLQAATVWNGPILSYTQPSLDPAQPANQDRLTANVWLTRASSSGLFDAATESAFTHGTSPAGTTFRRVGRIRPDAVVEAFVKRLEQPGQITRNRF